ncbi:hypothetical protein M885DRAFT_612082 [Pelagophyceae sp. CCMP2097]|nr:hypothetical protein M885DRAFT_612082 [Pelagophyceae sp. CCMP2097]
MLRLGLVACRPARLAWSAPAAGARRHFARVARVATRPAAPPARRCYSKTQPLMQSSVLTKNFSAPVRGRFVVAGGAAPARLLIAPQRGGAIRRASGPGRSGLSRLLGVGAMGAMLFGKVKYVLLAMKLTKFAPVISMVISSAAYSLVFGPGYGCGMVALLAVHEGGHALAMRAYGIPFSPMIMIPFIGAMIQMERAPAGAFEDSVIALAGPVVGSVGAVACAVGGHALDSQLLMALGDWGFMINLFNLLPIGGLDGGRVGEALHPALPAVGLLGGCGLAYAGIVSNPIFYLILLGGAFQVGSRLFGFSEVPPEYKRLAGGRMFGIAAAYAAIVAALIIMMGMNNVGRKSARRIKAEQSGGFEEPPPGKADEPYDDYFAEFIAGTENPDDGEY